MIYYQVTGADRTTISFSDIPEFGDDAFNFAEDTVVLTPALLVIISHNALSNDTAKTLCSLDGEFSASTDAKKPAEGGCKDSSDVKLCPADLRAWAFRIGTNVIGLNSNSSDPVALAGDQPSFGDGEFARIGHIFLSDHAAAAAGRHRQFLTDKNN
ncbi:hypothetical protein FJ420_31805 [Mesorhizobium sp. B3-1-3]|uniref:hypothetical protein n=1 Tax=unclassified Mesorhizobium TaxID=325217 RepID=UPI001129662E|nr:MULTISPECIES: hypothetical protein [unclassified Mesorhizobium]TPI53339.1 hypothetical protein FJ424_32150 [Mesorhizobium sp. B3-1-8]TPI60173.1 hypothetical protein FJ420_31805 [Mesorhizobium sp. B3-1-3]